MCSENDTFERAFLECQSFKKLCDESHQWFNNLHNTNVSLTSLQIFLNLPTVSISLSDKQIKDLRLLLLHVKQYHYERKTIQEKATTSEFMSKLIIQLKIDSAWCDCVPLIPNENAFEVAQTNLLYSVKLSSVVISLSVCTICKRFFWRALFLLLCVL